MDTERALQICDNLQTDIEVWHKAQVQAIKELRQAVQNLKDYLDYEAGVPQEDIFEVKK